MNSSVFDSMKIGLASPEQIRSWSSGEVTKFETINYRTLKPEKDGLFCERIFGPCKDGVCRCGKRHKIDRNAGDTKIVCDKCGVEITSSRVRRERMGHIELAAPVSHIWYVKGVPSRIGTLLDIRPKDLESVLTYCSYVVVVPGQTSLQRGQILDQDEYRDYYTKYDVEFNAQMGAEAILLLLATVGLPDDLADRKIALLSKKRYCERAERLGKEVYENEKMTEAELQELEEIENVDRMTMLSNQIREELEDASAQKRARLLKRLDVVDAFRLSDNKPEWMILDVIPVIPPEIRPMVQLDGGRFAVSDLNDLYREVIIKNNRLKRFIEEDAPIQMLHNELRVLQDAVDALIDNSRKARPSTKNKRPRKSLSDSLKGKQGRFRQNLLGKRVDYSGRSVIVVGPELKMYQCGLPKEMALELFKPFVQKRMADTGTANNAKQAKKKIERMEPEVWDALEVVIKDHPVMLNRAPTLHRLGIQAFEPVLVEGHAIKLHPLVCTAFNADFDGDQMAVHVPLSAEAQAEARFLMLAAGNLLKPSDGKPVTVPTQDMVLGSYYLTYERDGELGEGKVFRDENEALMAYDAKVVSLHAKIKVRRTIEIDGEKKSRLVDTTVGRIIFNRPIPQDLGFVDRSTEESKFEYEVNFKVDKKKLSQIVEKCIKKHGPAETSEVLDAIKSQGYHYSTVGSLTVAVCDATIPPQKQELIKEAEAEIDEVYDMYNDGLMSEEERYKNVVSIWNETTDKVGKALNDNMDPFNPIFMMADSGARGSSAQIRQLAGMRGLIADTSGRAIEVPIRANYREGLNIFEYFIASRGARKGLADTALRTADSGYLTRRLVDVAQDVIIRERDCGTTEGIEVYDIKDGDSVIEPLTERLVGRYLVEDFVDPKTKKVVVSCDELITEDTAKLLVDKYGLTRVKVRSIITCQARHGVCAHCYGVNLATVEPVTIGEAVGTIAAQSIGEPGTQLTMRTFHTGGIASGEDITQGLPRVEELFEARNPKNHAIITEIAGEVSFGEEKKKRLVIVTGKDEDGDPIERKYVIPFGTHIRVMEGDKVVPGDKLTEGSINPHDIMEVLGAQAVQDYLIKEVQSAYRLQAVKINDKHIEVIVRQMMRKAFITDAGDTNLLAGSTVDRVEMQDENEKVRARIAAGEEGLKEAQFKPVLLGITKAALATDSFLSAASFQETTRVLTDAAIKGKVDPLVGLKENVIIGKLIPAGTGIAEYNDVDVVNTHASDDTPYMNTLRSIMMNDDSDDSELE